MPIPQIRRPMVRRHDWSLVGRMLIWATRNTPR